MSNAKTAKKAAPKPPKEQSHSSKDLPTLHDLQTLRGQVNRISNELENLKKKTSKPASTGKVVEKLEKRQKQFEKALKDPNHERAHKAAVESFHDVHGLEHDWLRYTLSPADSTVCAPPPTNCIEEPGLLHLSASYTLGPPKALPSGETWEFLFLQLPSPSVPGLLWRRPSNDKQPGFPWAKGVKGSDWERVPITYERSPEIDLSKVSTPVGDQFELESFIAYPGEQEFTQLTSYWIQDDISDSVATFEYCGGSTTIEFTGNDLTKGGYSYHVQRNIEATSDILQAEGTKTPKPSKVTEYFDERLTLMEEFLAKEKDLFTGDYPIPDRMALNADESVSLGFKTTGITAIPSNLEELAGMQDSYSMPSDEGSYCVHRFTTPTPEAFSASTSLRAISVSVSATDQGNKSGTWVFPLRYEDDSTKGVPYLTQVDPRFGAIVSVYTGLSSATYAFKHRAAFAFKPTPGSPLLGITGPNTTLCQSVLDQAVADGEQLHPRPAKDNNAGQVIKDVIGLANPIMDVLGHIF